MADEKTVAEQVQEIMQGWNPPPEDHAMERIVGVPTDPAVTAATAHVPMEELNRGFQESDSDYSDDMDESYEDMTNDDLRAELEKRGLPKSGNKDELVARLEEDDASDEDEDDEEE
jgi:hypothetical protein